MSLFLRRINIGGRFPLVRLIQVIENPRYLLHIVKKNLFYKRERADYAPKYANFKFLPAQETLVELIKGEKSLARFGDGEFEQITGGGIYPPDSDWSQRWSKELARDLIMVLASTQKKLLVAVDPPSTFLASPNSSHAIRFECNMWVDMRRLMWKYLSDSVSYGHSHLFIKGNCPDLNWQQLRDFFHTKDIIVATGNVLTLSHLKLGRKTYFVECGTKNAYEKIAQIKQAIRRTMQNERLEKSTTLILASLGPTAGILAYQMVAEDICVWDTGHIFKLAAENFLENVFNTTGGFV